MYICLFICSVACTLQGRNNMFQAILLFFYHIKTKEQGMLGSVCLVTWCTALILLSVCLTPSRADPRMLVCKPEGPTTVYMNKPTLLKCSQYILSLCHFELPSRVNQKNCHQINRFPELCKPQKSRDHVSASRHKWLSFNRVCVCVLLVSQPQYSDTL